MKIALDAMGGDQGPELLIKGACQALRKNKELAVILLGPGDLLEQQVKQYTTIANIASVDNVIERLFVVLLFALPMLLGGCSNEKGEEQENKNVVEQASDKVAQKAVEYINKPLDKAKDSQALQNAQNEKMENMLEESEE